MSRLILSDHLMSKAEHVIPAINEANRYYREVLSMIQRTMIPLDIINTRLALIPIHIEQPQSASDIIYDFTTGAYNIHSYGTFENGHTIRKRMKCGIAIPKDIFEMDMADDIVDLYTKSYMIETINMLSEMESLFNDQIERIKPIRQMIHNPEAISKIGGI